MVICAADDVTDLCLSSTPLQAWPEKTRRVGVAIDNANINLDIKRRVH